MPLVTPAEMRGRVLAFEMVFIGASNELGAFESGVAGAVLGVGPAVWLGGILTMGVVGVASAVFPDLRDVDRFEDLEGGLPRRPEEAILEATESLAGAGTGMELDLDPLQDRGLR